MAPRQRDDGYDPNEEDRDTVLDAIAERVADVLEERFSPEPEHKPAKRSTSGRRPARRSEPDDDNDDGPIGGGFFGALFGGGK